MRKVLISFLLIAFSVTSFSQTTETFPAAPNTDYLKKSKNKNELVGSCSNGAAMMAVGIPLWLMSRQDRFYGRLGEYLGGLP
jgi:hypothetical protein